MEKTGAPPKTVGRVPKVVDEIVSKYSSIKEWGVVGFCWGGKIVNLTSQSDSKFKAAAAAHPAMVDPSDAPGVTIPYLMIPSKDEDKEAVEKWQKGLKVCSSNSHLVVFVCWLGTYLLTMVAQVKNQVQWFDDQVHGFMAARGDLSDEHVKKQYEKAYGLLLNFFHENM